MAETVCSDMCEGCPVSRLPLEKRKVVGSVTRALIAASIDPDPPFSVLIRLANNGLEEEGFKNPNEFDTTSVALAVMRVFTYLECDNYRVFE